MEISIKKAKDLEELGRRFNKIRPSYSIQFNETNYLGEGFSLAEFRVDTESGRTLMRIYESYVSQRNYSFRLRELTRSPRLTKEEIEYLLK